MGAVKENQMEYEECVAIANILAWKMSGEFSDGDIPISLLNSDLTIADILQLTRELTDKDGENYQQAVEIEHIKAKEENEEKRKEYPH